MWKEEGAPVSEEAIRSLVKDVEALKGQVVELSKKLAILESKESVKGKGKEKEKEAGKVTAPVKEQKKSQYQGKKRTRSD